MIVYLTLCLCLKILFCGKMIYVDLKYDLATHLENLDYFLENLHLENQKYDLATRFTCYLFFKI